MSRDTEIKDYLTNLDIPHCGAESITVMIMKLQTDGLYLIEQLEGADRALIDHERKQSSMEELLKMAYERSDIRLNEEFMVRYKKVMDDDKL